MGGSRAAEDFLGESGWTQRSFWRDGHDGERKRETTCRSFRVGVVVVVVVSGESESESEVGYGG